MRRANIVLCVSLLLLATSVFVSCKKDAATPAKAKTGGEAGAPAAAAGYDMTEYKKLAEEAMSLAKDDKQDEKERMAKAFNITKKLEKVFDDGTAEFKKADAKLWTEIDTQMDVAMDATNPSKEGSSPKKSVAELQKFIDMLAKVPAK
jgi:hypothetical protein